MVRTPWLRVLLLLVLTSLLGCAVPAGDQARVKAEVIAEGFASPVALVSPGDGSGRLFVVDQVGLIWIMASGRRLPVPFLDLRPRVVPLRSFYDERGLLGLAFHPDFAANGRFFVNYSAPLEPDLSPEEWDHITITSEFSTVPGEPDRADADSERILLAIPKPGYNDEAGHLGFGPDGYLYIATGDSVRDPAGEAGQFAQDPSSLLGKILRIDVDGGGSGAPYRSPQDNPYVGGGGQPEVYALGFRNPYRFSFDADAASGARFFVADVGQAMMEEVSLVVSGGNYGWPVREGTTCFNMEDWARPVRACSTNGFVDPIISYAHEESLAAIIGGMVYRGRSLPALLSGYVFGDWGQGNGRLFVAWDPGSAEGSWAITEIEVELPSGTKGIGQLLGIGEDEEGELYLLAKDPGLGPVGDTGTVYRLAAP